MIINRSVDFSQKKKPLEEQHPYKKTKLEANILQIGTVFLLHPQWHAIGKARCLLWASGVPEEHEHVEATIREIGDVDQARRIQRSVEK
jgi:hypothetical protein